MKTHRRAISLAVLCLLFTGLTSLSAKLTQESTGLSKQLQERLQNLPHSLSHQKSLFVRFRHVDSVQFFGAGVASRYTFKHSHSLLPEGLSLTLDNTGKESWATGIVHFKQPLDLSKYNSMVVWVRAMEPHTRIWMGLRTDALQARTDVLPKDGFPENEIVQLVIPLSRFFSKPRINLAWVTHLTFEFGQDTVGNKKLQDLKIYGVAFIEQQKPVARAQMIFNRARPKVMVVESTKALSPEDRAQSAQPMTIVEKTPAPATPPQEMSQMGRTVQRFLNMTEAQASNFFKSMGFDFKSGGDKESANKKTIQQPASFHRDYIQPYTRSWPVVAYADDSKAPDMPVSAATLSETPTRTSYNYVLLLLAAVGGWFLWVRRRKTGMVNAGLAKVILEIHWPFVSLQAPTKRVERDFWKGVAAQQTRFCWLSATDMVIERSSPEKYFGEDFLRRQIDLAAKSDVHLLPSLSFTQNIFDKEALLSNPQRAVMALRTLVTETLLRFSDVAAGVRVEDAASFLNSNLKLSKNALLSHHEFWKDIIATVRARRPHFLFIADAVHEHATSVRKIGFDYFENDAVVTSLLSYIKDSNAAGLENILSGDSAKNLSQSIYNIFPILADTEMDSVDEHTKRQNMLTVILLTLLPGVIQHEGYMSDELGRFIARISHSSVLRRGDFAYLPSSAPDVLAFARWHKKSLFIAVANFSFGEKETLINLSPIHSGLDNNKLYLFNNALHGSNTLSVLLHQPLSNGPALALWGQNLKDAGFPLSLPGLSLSLFSVSLARPIAPVSTGSLASEGILHAFTK